MSRNILTRYMVSRDRARALAIHNAIRETPMEASDLDHLLRRRIGVAAEMIHPDHGALVVGWASYQSFEHHLLVKHLMVDPAFRRLGVGQAMLRWIIGRARDRHRRDGVQMILRESDLGSHLWARDTGGKALVVVREAFADTGEDGYRFAWERAPASQHPLHFSRRTAP